RPGKLPGPAGLQRLDISGRQFLCHRYPLASRHFPPLRHPLMVIESLPRSVKFGAMSQPRLEPAGLGCAQKTPCRPHAAYRMRGSVSMFLIRAAFWFSVVVLLIPGDPNSGTEAPRVGAIDAIVAAQGAVA